MPARALRTRTSLRIQGLVPCDARQAGRQAVRAAHSNSLVLIDSRRFDDSNVHTVDTCSKVRLKREALNRLQPQWARHLSLCTAPEVRGRLLDVMPLRSMASASRKRRSVASMEGSSH
jgi:hypothetical protein